MAKHVVQLAVRRFYYVLVDDEGENMNDEAIVSKAKEMAYYDNSVLKEDDLEKIEKSDFLDGEYYLPFVTDHVLRERCEKNEH